MRTICISLIAVWCGCGSAATSYDVHPASKELLERKPLELSAEGVVDISFERAESILMRTNLLSVIQESYVASLPEGETPEFTVQRQGPSRYHYTNCKGQNTIIEEVWIRRDPGQKISIALYSEGRRFFGDYQSLCDVEVTPTDDGCAVYSVTVYARPEAFLYRVAARIAPVQRFFRSKMHELTDLVVEVCNGIPVDESKGEEYADVSFSEHLRKE